MSDEGNGKDIRRRVEKAGQIFDRYGGDIRAIIDFNVKDKAGADDIFQDLFVSLVRNPIPPKVEDIRAYLFRAVANDVVDRFRRTKNHQEVARRYAERHKNRAVQKDPHNIVAQAEETARALRLIKDQLAGREARAIVQRHGCSLNTSDTAVQLNVDKRSVSRYLAEGMRKMRCLALGNGGIAK